MDQKTLVEMVEQGMARYGASTRTTWILIDSEGRPYCPTMARLVRAVARLEATDTRNADGSLSEETEEACELLEIGLYSLKMELEEAQ